MNFFLDNTFPPGLSRAVAELAKEHGFQHMLEAYPKGDPGSDLIWIPEIAKRKEIWRVLSGDRRLLTNPQNRAAVVSNKLIVFVMPSGFPSLVKWEQCAHFFRWFPEIEKKAAKSKPGDLFEVSMRGKVDPAK